jgi:hypothetical protein
MIGAKGYSMEVPLPFRAFVSKGVSRQIESDTLFLEDVVAGTFECDVGRILKPALDRLWKACGWERSAFYDNYEWVGLAKSF